jgi:hypothetical protein
VLSQLAARALLLSIFLFRDIRYIPFFALGLLTAYSGTGVASLDRAGQATLPPVSRDVKRATRKPRA